MYHAAGLRSIGSSASKINMSLENLVRPHFLNAEEGVEQPAPATTRVTIDGRTVEGLLGEPLIDTINRETGKELAQVCYLQPLGPIETCDTCMVEVNGKLVRACGTRRRAAHERLHREHPRPGRAARSLRPHPRQPPALLHRLRQQQRELHRPQHHRAPQGRAPVHPLPPKALREGRHQPLLPLRSRPVHPLRPLRRSLPECPGQRDPHHSLGRRAPPRPLGRRFHHRRILLRLLRPLRHRLPLQRAHGKIHARQRRLSSPASRARRSST